MTSIPTLTAVLMSDSELVREAEQVLPPARLAQFVACLERLRHFEECTLENRPIARIQCADAAENLDCCEIVRETESARLDHFIEEINGTCECATAKTPGE
jgi:hypothetical protein